MQQTIRRVLKTLGLRKPVRRARDCLLGALGCPQAYVELAKLARRTPGVKYLDIGCHHGATIQRFLDMAGPVPVVAFDPNEANISFAKASVKTRGPLRFVQAAVADQDGSLSFFDNANEQTSSLLPNADGNLRSFPEATRPVGTREVDVVQLDTWVAAAGFRGPAIIKCDTQGAEAKVIRGGLRFVREQTIAFYSEVMLDRMYQGQPSFQELRDLLEGGCGLVLRQVYPCLHDAAGRAVQFDALWVSRDALNALR